MINDIINYLIKNKIYDIKVFESNIFGTDYIVLGTAISNKQLEVVSLKLKKFLKGKYILKVLICGQGSSWVVVDLDCIIIHVMLSDTRLFYGLEELYSKQ